MAYDQAAIEFVLSFYLRGFSYEKARPEIDKVYAGFSLNTWDQWSKKHNWPRRRAELDHKRSEFFELCRDGERVLLEELTVVKDKVLEKIQEPGAELKPQLVFAYKTVASEILDIIRNHNENKDPGKIAMVVLEASFGQFLQELKEVKGFQKLLFDNSELIGRIVANVAQNHGREHGAAA